MYIHVYVYILYMHPSLSLSHRLCIASDSSPRSRIGPRAVCRSDLSLQIIVNKNTVRLPGRPRSLPIQTIARENICIEDTKPKHPSLNGCSHPIWHIFFVQSTKKQNAQIGPLRFMSLFLCRAHFHMLRSENGNAQACRFWSFCERDG